jgi:hypothetical protein
VLDFKGVVLAPETNDTAPLSSLLDIGVDPNEQAPLITLAAIALSYTLE